MSCIWALKLKLENANIVLFLGSTFHKTFPNLPKKKYVHQIYALHSMEQPAYVPLLTRPLFLNKHFDLMFTYSQSAVYPQTSVPNLPLSYYPSHVYPPEAVLSPPLPFTEKSGFCSGGYYMLIYYILFHELIYIL
jgi:hypothetical protein